MTSTSRVKLVTTFSQFDSALADSNTIVVVLYTAPGCPHCNRFLPALNSMSVESGMSSVSFYNVNLMSGDGLGIARRNNVSGVPHTAFYSRSRKLGDMRGDSADEFRKLLVKYKAERGFVGAGYTLGGSAGAAASSPPRAMGDSKTANADALERRAPPAEKVDKLIGMGFPRDRAIAALQRANNDADTAADILLGGGSAEDQAWMQGVGAAGAASAAASPRIHKVKCGVGLGLADCWDNAGPKVADILPYSPAAESKAFHRGDRIVEIDGTSVKGLRVDVIKPLILGDAGTTIDITFLPSGASAWSPSPFSSADPFRMAERPITITLTRTVRREQQAEADAAADGSSKPPWYSVWWENVQKGSAKASKNVEEGLLAAGERIGEAGSAIGKTAKAGWEGTSKVAVSAGKSVKEGTKVAGEKLTEAGAAVKETVVVDTLARKRLAELEEENRRLREQLERQTLLEEAQAQAIAAEMVEGGGYSSVRSPAATASGGGRGGSTEVSVVGGWGRGGGAGEGGGDGGAVRSFDPADFKTAPSTDAEWCEIRVRLMDGTNLEGKFKSTAKLQEILEFAIKSESERKELTLMFTYPRRIFGPDELPMSLRECGLVPAATLVVTKMH